ncbi:hypothetical protein PspCFBP13508_15185 [Pseudomonas sp. CFBP13508]|jgi:hypothetical protein|uniref:Uncharacterized protein n=1 Tax=Pseudomonas mercuritolerans TaxID=2951809 RepID=A0ABT2XSR9_9PSED|nr:MULTISPECIES: hypothetical protein [Pseudomonas]MCV2221740.1 hypothetical protein [Pseudomonas mercuritolerans]TKJ71980.1 hypothetical protein PspCFBP13508_15185 [Pseudomonas sp. CFBP13508]
MQKKCDLYLCEAVDASQLNVIRLFDKAFVCENGTKLSGYLSISVNRVKLVAVVSDFRRRQIPCFSVPVEYREARISFEAALQIAQAHAMEQGLVGAENPTPYPPLFWSFVLVSKGATEKKTGGVIMVDRLDGHIWGLEEYEEYMYDYNNLF